jgi:hypothetical protein
LRLLDSLGRTLGGKNQSLIGHDGHRCQACLGLGHPAGGRARLRRINIGRAVCGRRMRRRRRRRRRGRDRLDTLHIFRLNTEVPILQELREKASPRIITEDQVTVDTRKGIPMNLSE